MNKPRKESSLFNATSSLNSSDRNKIKHNTFATFHRVLDSVKVSDGLARVLIFIEFFQIISMTVNENNTILVSDTLPTGFWENLNLLMVYPMTRKLPLAVQVLTMVPVAVLELSHSTQERKTAGRPMPPGTQARVAPGAAAR